MSEFSIIIFHVNCYINIVIGIFDDKIYNVLIFSYALRNIRSLIVFFLLYDNNKKSWLTEGRTESKWFVQAAVSSKKQTNEFDFTTMIHQVDLFSFIIWKKLKTPKRHFEINWPLVLMKKLGYFIFATSKSWILKFLIMAIQKKEVGYLYPWSVNFYMLQNSGE